MRASAGRPGDAAGRALAAAARAADRGLDALGLAPPPLDLPSEVRADLDGFFAGTIDPTPVVIRRGHVPGVPHRRAFALPGLIYLGADPGIVVMTDPGPTRLRATPTLVHELTHIWQGRYLGPRYVVRALSEQIRLGRRAYDWRAAFARGAHDAPAGQGPGVLPVEAHAQLVSEAYAAGHGFAPTAVLSGRDHHLRAVEHVLTGLRAGDVSTLRGRTV
ncbi:MULTISPECIES: hypothetical protein [Dietzia]|uniref:DUF4157 domain-containing protein n=1 Tax=Dietzia maris TaxID=37915 RepID=A0ABT8GXK2_9ACTN|nr:MULTISPECIES: hypothetical protein [Dietzia]MDJ0421616.1 hypothetical protein [Dietzia kunjamensis]MDN4504752.1 hypothetical protein [Dietzia maris]MDV3355543.1 hypothetical protein [Dietzia sp. IN118]